MRKTTTGRLPRRRFGLLLGPGLLWAAAAHAQGVAPELAWECWVDGHGGVPRIRCLRTAGAGLAEPEPGSIEQEQAIVHAHVRGLLHEGGPRELSRAADTGRALLPEGGLWAIPIHNMPSEDSWAEGSPAALVRALLCPSGRACRVWVRPPNLVGRSN